MDSPAHKLEKGCESNSGKVKSECCGFESRPEYQLIKGKNMQINLDRKWVEYFQDQPETSMGSQGVNIQLKNGLEVRGLVINCSILFTRNPINIDDVEKMTVERRSETDDSSIFLG